MSKTVIRNGMFETNSSSVHSICISKNSVIAKVKSIPINGMTVDEMFKVVRTTNWED